jgi:cell division protein FtsB
VTTLHVALEALVSTLRTHLARLTSELASHKSLIAELRADAYASRETQAEVEALRAEVERLAGEVERLKEIVEEGLRERRRARLDMDDANDDGSQADRDQTTVPAQVGIDLTYVTAPISRDEEREERDEPLTMEDLDPEPEQGQRRDARQKRDSEPIPIRPRRFVDVRFSTDALRAGTDCTLSTGF